MARCAPAAVLLYRRRGKETWVIKITYADKSGKPRQHVEVGARFNGRFYPSRCDLSPDGKHFAYFVMGGYQGKKPEDHLYCWTAMSRPPALTAEFLLPQRDTWGGAACFIDNANLLVAAGMYSTPDEIKAANGREVSGVKVCVPEHGGKVPDHIARLKPVPDGWSGSISLQRVDASWSKEAGRCRLFRRYREDWIRRGGFGFLQYRLSGDDNSPVLQDDYMDQVTWADVDQLGRLWLAHGTVIDIYARPRPGMPAHPNRTIDLETAVAAARRHA